MYRRDIVLDEAQKLAQLIAKLIGLKGSSDEEAEVFYQTQLNQAFDLCDADLLELDDEQFKALLLGKALSAQKLDALAQFIYHREHPFTLQPNTLLRLEKVRVILNVLEHQYRQQSFENIRISKQIDQYITEYHA